MDIIDCHSGSLLVVAHRIRIRSCKREVPQEFTLTHLSHYFTIGIDCLNGQDDISRSNLIPDRTERSLWTLCSESPLLSSVFSSRLHGKLIGHCTLNLRKIKCRSINEFLGELVPEWVSSLIARTDRLEIFLCSLCIELLNLRDSLTAGKQRTRQQGSNHQSFHIINHLFG